MTGRIRYGARSDEERRAALLRREEAPPVWSEAVNAVWETDPEAVAAVLPRPLQPGERPLVRATITRVEMAGMVFGAGYFAVSARHEGEAGEYPLLMPMTSERAMTGGRETFGEPKKMGTVEVAVEGDGGTGAAVTAVMARLGVDLVSVSGRLGDPVEPPPERTKKDFYFKFLLDPSGKGFDEEPALVHCTKVERIRSIRPIESGSVVLGDSPFDPVADLPVVAMVELTHQERSTLQRGEIVTRVPSDWILPFAHQRYDDPLP